MRILFKIGTWILGVVFLFVIVFLLFEISPFTFKVKKDNAWRLSKDEETLIIPHGGAKKLYPENTKYAFENTDEYDVFEIDLCLTKDNLLISHHDLNLDLMANKPEINVIDKTYNEIIDLIKSQNYPCVRNFEECETFGKDLIETTNQSILDDLVPIPVEEIFKKYPNKRYILELKDITEVSGEEAFKKASKILLDLIIKYDLKNKVVVSSFDDSAIKYFRSQENAKDILTSTATKETFNFALASALTDIFYKPVAEVLILPCLDNETVSGKTGETLSKLPGFLRDRFAINVDGVMRSNLHRKGVISDAKRHNMAVLYWTVNDEEMMKKLVDMKVDGIITDRPDLLRRVINQKNSK